MKNIQLKSDKKKIPVYMVIVLLLAVLVLAGMILDGLETNRLNKKYNQVIPYNYELRRYCEINADEYIMSGKCGIFDMYIEAAVQLENIYYNDLHSDIQIVFIIRENKFGKIEYTLGFEDDNDPNFGGPIYLDQDFHPVSRYGMQIDDNNIKIMEDLQDEVARVVEIANEKWKLDIVYEK